MVRPFVKHYQVVGRETPSEKNQSPTVYKYEVFAPNFVVAKSRFWRLMKDKNKIKATNGDILLCKVVKDRKIAARNYAVTLAYYSQKCGYTHMTKEFRDVSKAGAVSQSLNDMASRHRARFAQIEVLNVKSIPDAACKRMYVKQFHSPKLAFPLLSKPAKKTARKDRQIFKAKRSSRGIM